jgi:hypothetical protein
MDELCSKKHIYGKLRETKAAIILIRLILVEQKYSKPPLHRGMTLLRTTHSVLLFMMSPKCSNNSVEMPDLHLVR